MINVQAGFISFAIARAEVPGSEAAQAAAHAARAGRHVRHSTMGPDGESRAKGAHLNTVRAGDNRTAFLKGFLFVFACHASNSHGQTPRSERSKMACGSVQRLLESQHVVVVPSAPCREVVLARGGWLASVQTRTGVL